MNIKDMFNKAKFYNIDSVSIKPTDVIIIKVEQTIDDEIAEKLKYYLKQYFPDNKCFVLGKGADILIARKEDNAPLP